MKSRDFSSFRVVLVDNASSDGTVQMVKKAYQWSDIIINSENVGFAAACNQAVETSSSPYVLFLNPDIEVESDAISRMIEKMDSSDDIGILGGLVFDASGCPQHSARRQIPELTSAFFHLTGLSKFFPRSSLVNQYTQAHASPFEEGEVGAVSGSFLMSRRDALDLVSGFDEEFFLYGEDMDLCLRIDQKGFRVVYYPEARALHHHRTSTRKSPFRSTYHFYRSMGLFYRKHYGKGTGRIISPLVSLACWFLLLIQLMFGERVRLSGGVVRIEKWWMKFVFILLDMLSVVGSWFLAVYLRFGHLKPLPPFGDYRSYVFFIVIFLVVTYGSLFYLRAYRLKPRAVKTAFKSTLLVFIILNLVFFYSKPIAFSRLVLVYFSVFLFFSLMLWRLLFHATAISSLSKNLYQRRVAVAGTGKEILRLLSGLRPEEDGYQLIGVIGKAELAELREYTKPFLGTYSEIKDIVESLSIDEVIVVDDDESESSWLIVSGYLRDCQVRLRLLTRELAGKLDSGVHLRLEDLPPIP
jgi:GT2 family glycosyltransferase